MRRHRGSTYVMNCASFSFEFVIELGSVVVIVNFVIMNNFADFSFVWLRGRKNASCMIFVHRH